MQGVAMTVGSLARAIVPTLGAECFAWSLTNGLALPFDAHFVFLLMCALVVAPLAIGLATFSKALDLPMEASATPRASRRTSSTGGGEGVESTVELAAAKANAEAA